MAARDILKYTVYPDTTLMIDEEVCDFGYAHQTLSNDRIGTVELRCQFCLRREQQEPPPAALGMLERIHSATSSSGTGGQQS